jgi:LAO/AO transport system kinase
MCDFYLLLLLPAAGDELQGIKKGTVELAEAIVVNKADGESYQKALSTMESYWTALHYINSPTEGWQIKVFTCSALTGNGIANVWQEIEDFIKFSEQTELFQTRRSTQSIDWFVSMLEERVLNQFYNNSDVKRLLPNIKEQILNNVITPSRAVDMLLLKPNI